MTTEEREAAAKIVEWYNKCYDKAKIREAEGGGSRDPWREYREVAATHADKLARAYLALTAAAKPVADADRERAREIAKTVMMAKFTFSETMAEAIARMTTALATAISTVRAEGRAEGVAAERGTRWRSMETAPRDGSSILIVHNRTRPAMQAVVYWNDEARDPQWPWSVDDADFAYHLDYPTDWMPLHDPPSAIRSGSAS